MKGAWTREAPEPASDKVSFARGLLALRRARHRFFPDVYLADPAWDILLDLYVAARTARRVSVSSLCVAAGVPQTTALRWIKLLTDDGLLERSDDAEDKRRVYVALSTDAVAAMDACLTAGHAILRDMP